MEKAKQAVVKTSLQVIPLN